MLRFGVSSVTPGKKCVGEENVTLLDCVQAVSGRKDQKGIEASGLRNLPSSTLLVQATINPFVLAVHIAFQSHYPLELSPDMIWICITQGLGHHILDDPEKYRKEFVSHDGKEDIVIRRDEFVKGDKSNDWPGVFSEISQNIQQHIGEKNHSMIVSDFSTTGPLEKVVSELTLLNAMQEYFDVTLMTECGIPEIILTGTLEDWQSIRNRIEGFAALDLEWWLKGLRPVLDNIVQTKKVQGPSNDELKEFWKSLYKEDGSSGGPYTAGWINALFPYVQMYGSMTKNVFVQKWKEAFTDRWNSGPTTAAFPKGLCTIPFKWSYLGTPIPMEFAGGFVCVSHDSKDLIVKPELGWAVLEKDTSTASHPTVGRGSDIGDKMFDAYPEQKAKKKDGCITS